MDRFGKYIIVLFLFCITALQAHSPLVTSEWLAAHYDDPHLVIVDVREPELYRKGHLKHAVNVPVFRELFDTKHHYMLPKLDKLQTLFSRIGIDDASRVVVYGNNQLIWAARFYWISQMLGHKDVTLLRVGYGNWEKGLLPIDTKDYIPKPTQFIPKVDNTILDTKLSVFISIHKDVIIDGRPAEFYKGIKSHAKRFGHIPTALNYPGAGNYDMNGSGMKPFAVLKELYKKLPKDKRIILYCEDGADAALNFLVLQELGYNVSVYDGSWLEWGNDANLPIER